MSDYYEDDDYLYDEMDPGEDSGVEEPEIEIDHGGYSPLGYATKQEAYFAWREDYDNWKDENYGVPWWYKDDPPQWSQYWCEPVEQQPVNSQKDSDRGGVLLVVIVLIICFLLA